MTDEVNDAANTLPEEVKRYIMVELHCDMTQCKPCTYPKCPLLEEKRDNGSVTVELSKGPEHVMIDGQKVMKEDVKRYIMVETSCDRTKCDPCTYPNCQRFVRDMSLENNNQQKEKPKVKRVMLIDRNGTVIDSKDDKKENKE